MDTKKKDWTQPSEDTVSWKYCLCWTKNTAVICHFSSSELSIRATYGGNQRPRFTTGLVAELTFVRLNDLAAPPDPTSLGDCKTTTSRTSDSMHWQVWLISINFQDLLISQKRCPLGCCGTGPRYSLWRRWSHGWSLSTPFCTLDQRMSNESNESNGSKCVQLFFVFMFSDVFCWCVHFSVWFGRVVCVPLNTEDHMILSFSGWVFKWILNIRAGTVGSGASWLLPVCWVWKLDFGRWWWAVGNSSVDPRHCSTWNPSPFVKDASALNL